METLLAVVAVTLFPCVTLLVLLGLTAWVERWRAAVIARQIELTDAIHREVGAVVAPWVTRRPGRTRLAAWLRRLRRHERQGPLTGARAARWPRRADTS